jgi:hypothetical protein
VLVDVAVVAADALVATRGEGERSRAGQDHHPDGRIVPGEVERLDQLPRGERAERVADLGPGHRDLRDPVGRLVSDVGEGRFCPIRWPIPWPRSTPCPIQGLTDLTCLIHMTVDS